MAVGHLPRPAMAATVATVEHPERAAELVGMHKRVISVFMAQAELGESTSFN